jgi:hypothetical protein
MSVTERHSVPVTVCPWNVQKMHIAFFVTFAFFEDIVYVAVDDTSVTKEQV